MKSMIEELWFNNICRSEQEEDTPEAKALLGLISTNREKLCETMTDAQKERLSRYDDCIEELEGLRERDAFVYGFCLGLRMVSEAFCGL